MNNITQVSCLKVLGVTLQSNHRFNERIKVKLQEANKCLYVIRCLRKEGYQQPDVDYVFRSIVLPKLTYGPVYASSIPELTTVQNFLQHCFKRKYISYQIDIIIQRIRRGRSLTIQDLRYARSPSVLVRPQNERKLSAPPSS